MTPEKKVQNAIIKYLIELEKEGHPLFHQRRQAGGFNYKKGIPDLYAVYNGIHIEIEVKSEKGELRVMQEKFRNKCKRLNILYIKADNLDDFKEFMNLHFKLQNWTIFK